MGKTPRRIEYNGCTLLPCFGKILVVRLACCAHDYDKCRIHALCFIRRREAFWGRSWPDSPELRCVRHTGKFPLTYFDGNALCARAVRFLTGHAPTGEYRVRFHPHMPSHCDCWVGGIHDRLHIVDQCSWFDLTSPYRTPFRLFTESLDPFPLIATWLRTFSGAFTFAFSHSPECDPLCVTCSPTTWSYHDERYDYESQFEMVREPRHFPHIGA